MLIPTEDGEYVNSRALVRLVPGEADAGAVAHLASGEVVQLLYSEGMVLAMEGTVLPANEGFSKLIFPFSGTAPGSGVYERHPIIGWRVVGNCAPEPITPQQDSEVTPDAFEGVCYPSGEIIVGAKRYASLTSWLDAAREACLEFLKDNDPRH